MHTEPRSLRVALSRQGDGVTFEFPLPNDHRLAARRVAWRVFEAGVFLLMATVIWFGACSILHWYDWRYLSFLPFAAGIIALIVAATKSTNAWREPENGDDLCQLSIVEDRLVRTTRDQRRQAWPCENISAIEVESDLPAEDELQPGGNDYVRLMLELRSGGRVELQAWPVREVGIRAEAEWIADVLREALQLDSNAMRFRAGRPI